MENSRTTFLSSISLSLLKVKKNTIKWENLRLTQNEVYVLKNEKLPYYDGFMFVYDKKTNVVVMRFDLLSTSINSNELNEDNVIETMKNFVLEELGLDLFYAMISSITYCIAKDINNSSGECINLNNKPKGFKLIEQNEVLSTYKNKKYDVEYIVASDPSICDFSFEDRNNNCDNKNLVIYIIHFKSPEKLLKAKNGVVYLSFGHFREIYRKLSKFMLAQKEFEKEVENYF